MKSVCLILIAMSACTPGDGLQRSIDRQVEKSAALAVGQVVTEIDPRIWCIYQDRDGDYWFGSNGGGVYRCDEQRIVQYTRADGLSGDRVRDIKEDRDGQMLISTTAGVVMFDGTAFKPLDIVDAHPGDDGWALDLDDIWLLLNPDEDGVGRFDGRTLYRLQLSKSPAEVAFRARHPDVGYSPSGVYSVYRDRQGNVWFGTAAVGLCRFDGATLSWLFEERLTTTPDGGAFGIRSIYQDHAGDYWICNTRQRFEILPDITQEGSYSLLQYRKKAGLPDAQADSDTNFTYYLSVIEDEAGALWMACGEDGVWKFDGEDITRYPVSGNTFALCLYRDHAGKLWLGTAGHGVFTFNGTEFEPFREAG